MVAECPRVPGVEGRTLAEIAAARRAPAEEVFIDLLLEADGQVSMINFLMLDANVARGLQFAHVTIGSDNLGLCAGPEHDHPGKPHPRQHGCFAKVLGTYVRERGVLTWEGAIHKMTGQSAARLGHPPWRSPPGAFADVVVRSGDGRRPGDLPGAASVSGRLPRRLGERRGRAEGGRFHPRPSGRVLAPVR
jgi:N-acyl-D-aspartate/D-glutamate deacylase